MRLLAALADRLLCLALAVGAAQFPLYYAQYLTVVAGAQAEASRRYEALRGAAEALGLEVEAFVRRHEQNGDAVFQASGALHRDTLSRHAALRAALAELREAPAWAQPLRLARHYDADLAAAVEFQPGLPLSVAGAAWAGLGLLLAMLISATLGWLWRRPPLPVRA